MELPTKPIHLLQGGKKIQQGDLIVNIGNSLEIDRSIFSVLKREREREAKEEKDIDFYLKAQSQLQMIITTNYTFCDVGIAKETPLPAGKSFHC